MDLAVGDFNEDGRQDFVTTNDGTSASSVRLGTCAAPPTAAPAFISGRVTSAYGVGLQNALVTVQGGNIEGTKSVSTGAFGLYRVEGLLAGESYMVTVRSRRYSFADNVRFVNLTQSLSDVNFTASP